MNRSKNKLFWKRWRDFWWMNFICLLLSFFMIFALSFIKKYEMQLHGHLPTLPFPLPIKYFFVMGYYMELVMMYFAIPVMTFVVVGMSYYTWHKKLHIRFCKTFRPPILISFDSLEENTDALVQELTRYRLQCFEEGEFYHDANLVPQKTIYYKKTLIEDLSEVEAENWPQLCHINISPLYEIKDTACQETFFAAEIFEWRYILSDILFNEGFNDRKDFFKFAIKWSHDVLMGLQYLHSKNLYHLDLEAENIMIDFDKAFTPVKSRAIIGNFEHMKKVCDKPKSVSESDIGFTEFYRPPEAFMLETVDAEKCDMWGLGIIILEIFTGGILRLWQNQFPSFSHKRRDQALGKILLFSNFCAAMESSHKHFSTLRKSSKWNEKAAEDSADFSEATFWQIWIFVTDLLKLDHHIRISMEQSIQHGFIENVCKTLCNENKVSKDTDEYKGKLLKNTTDFSDNKKTVKRERNIYSLAKGEIIQSSCMTI